MESISNPNERAFSFIPVNQRESKPRTRGITEIRGAYYTPMGKNYLQDIFETMGNYADALKFAGGSFSLMPRPLCILSSSTVTNTTFWFPRAAS